MKKTGTNFFIEPEATWEDLGNGLQRQLLGYTDTLMLVKVKFETGAVGSLHKHPHVQSSYVATGSFELTIGAEKKILHAGDGYFVPPNVLHGCICLQAGILIDAFSPYREDFINNGNK